MVTLEQNKKEEGLPSNVHIVYSERCNLRCRHCDLWKTCLSEVPLEELKGQIMKLKSWLGSFKLHLSGKEPFMRSDVYELLDFCKDNSLRISILTNGTLVVPDKLVRFKGSIGLSVSIDGIGDVHDRIRGVQGTFGKVNTVIDRFISLGISPTILTTIQKENQNVLKDIVYWADQKRLQVLFCPLHQNLGQEKSPLWWEESPVWPDKLDFSGIVEMKNRGFPIKNSVRHLQIMALYYENPRRNIMPCDVGKSHFIVDKGKVHLCFYRQPIAPFDNPEGIWFSDEADIERKEINKCRLNCNIDNCYYKE